MGENGELSPRNFEEMQMMGDVVCSLLAIDIIWKSQGISEKFGVGLAEKHGNL